MDSQCYIEGGLYSASHVIANCDRENHHRKVLPISLFVYWMTIPVGASRYSSTSKKEATLLCSRLHLHTCVHHVKTRRSNVSLLTILNRCHVAMMMGPICYSMECANHDNCKPKAAPESIVNQNPTIAYVKRGTITMAGEYGFLGVSCYFLIFSKKTNSKISQC